ncbi:hypothetical protein [Saccharibacillus sp. JS10]|uniref:hypothetical protein n=1 Tax=Saccharibacillus sp. JS10 TaxID=2950552 RepID=UPI00210CB4A5|nr:hypothetical protein [Saccharibacillus sp. JS10]MCQ4087489.1 hypothetical protein [Saccharibacillus sp. JS10]
MGKITVLSEVVMELCYFTFMMRRIGPLDISEDEVEAHLQKTTSLEVASFIKDGIKILKRGGEFSTRMKIFYEARMLECVRNPTVSLEELRAMHLGIYIFEYCSYGDLNEVIRISRNFVSDEFSGEVPLHESSDELVIKLIRVQEFLRKRDHKNITVDRKEYERYKGEDWKYGSRYWSGVKEENLKD